ncbi:hydroquinone glucosyltransferase-like [Phragmites australis]|uniref:hydroquinone glucosyltransferase-like n=1 Tax=Phragmites australis TaxID=29695 RepID=UPI002D794DBC|nr:hydroquinone glucosyltransferase-like [Phragmites australis]
MAEVHAPHVVVLTSPGAGHVGPVAELATRLAAHHGFTTTIVTYSNLSSPTHSSALASLPPRLSTTALPEVSLDDLPADAHIVTRILTVVRRTLPHLRALLRSLLDAPAGVTVFLTDMLCPAALAVAQELGVPHYVFFTSNLMSLVTLLYTPELARTTTCECRDLPEPVVLPGCLPLHGADLVEPVQDRSNPVYPLVIDLGLDYLQADGFIVNTFDAMEHETLETFKELSDKGVYPPAYAVGPFVRSFSDEAAKHHCMRWLDGQPDGSVLYVCFGSGGTLSTVQTAEMAAGLEASGQRFLWVVRFPNDKDSSASYFGTTTHGDDPLSYLPEGFTERTRDAGLAVPQWAPQVEILDHCAVGGFLSHCGWNSALEAVAAGVPLLAWPLFAEQRMNAVKLSSEHVGLALRVRAREDGVVPREGVAAMARELMVGEKGAAARKKARELRAEAQKASVPGGPAHQMLAAVANTWKCAAGPAVGDGGV